MVDTERDERELKWHNNMAYTDVNVYPYFMDAAEVADDFFNTKIREQFNLNSARYHSPIPYKIELDLKPIDTKFIKHGLKLSHKKISKKCEWLMRNRKICQNKSKLVLVVTTKYDTKILHLCKKHFNVSVKLKK